MYANARLRIRQDSIPLRRHLTSTAARRRGRSYERPPSAQRPRQSIAAAEALPASRLPLRSPRRSHALNWRRRRRRRRGASCWRQAREGACPSLGEALWRRAIPCGRPRGHPSSSCSVQYAASTCQAASHHPSFLFVRRGAMQHRSLSPLLMLRKCELQHTSVPRGNHLSSRAALSSGARRNVSTACVECGGAPAASNQRR